MKTSLKIGLLAGIIGIVSAGCFGCGDGDRGGRSKPDTPATIVDSNKKIGDTAKTKLDTAKKDTTKIK